MNTNSSRVHYEPIDHPQMARVLQQLAQTYQVNLYAVPRRSSCYDRGRCDFCRGSEPRDQTEWIYVNFNCNGRRTITDPPLNNLYTYEMTRRTRPRENLQSRLLPSGNGRLIVDPHGTPVAEVIGKSIYVLVNLEAKYFHNGTYTYRYWRHSADVLKLILEEAIPPIVAQEAALTGLPPEMRVIEQRRQTLAAKLPQTLTQVHQAMTANRDGQINSITRDIASARSNADEYYRNWLEQERQIQVWQAMLAGLENGSGIPLEQIQQEVADILAMPEVIGMEADGNRIIVHTDTIYIPYRGRNYRIGAFRIAINFRDGTVRMRNVSHRAGYYDHPHIKDEVCCWGNIREGVANLVKQYELQTLVTLLIEFLKSYAQDGSPYQYIDTWQVA